MTQDQIETAVNMRAQGAKLKDIAAVVNYDPGNLCREFQKDDIKSELVKAQKQYILNNLTKAVNNQSAKIDASGEIIKRIIKKEKLTDGAVKLMELAHDAENKLLQATGIHQAHTQAIVLNNILVDNRQELSPAIESMLTQHLLGNAKVEGNDIEGQIRDAEMVKE